jgi:type IV secretory pathway TraG/TraD family ATPase VirD4
LWLWDITKEEYKNVFGSKDEPDSHGAARWATEKDLKPFHKPDGFLLAEVNKKKVYAGTERNVMVCAPPGTGKSRMFAAMLIDRANRKQDCDIIIADPAGDIEELTRAEFVRNGFAVKTLNIINPSQTEAYFDPMGYFSNAGPFDIEGRTNQIAGLLAPDDSMTKESHFQDSARNVVQAALLKANSEDVPMTLYQVIEVLTSPKRISSFFEGSSIHASLIMRIVAGAFEAVSDKERGSFMSTISRKVKPFGSAAARYVLGENGKEEVNFRKMYADSGRHVTYIRGGIANTDNGAIVRLILGIAIYERAVMWNEGVRFAKDLEVYVDETKLLGECRALQIMVDTLRKARCRLAHTWLALGDVKETVKGHQSFIGASEQVIFGGGRDMESYEQASRIFGDKTIENVSANESDSGKSKGFSEQARRLIKADELRLIPPDEVVFTLGVLNCRGKKLKPPTLPQPRDNQGSSK